MNDRKGRDRRLIRLRRQPAASGVCAGSVAAVQISAAASAATPGELASARRSWRHQRRRRGRRLRFSTKRGAEAVDRPQATAASLAATFVVTGVERTSRPGRAPVSASFRRVTVPATIVAT